MADLSQNSDLAVKLKLNDILFITILTKGKVLMNMNINISTV
jgi:hypothetical protein